MLNFFSLILWSSEREGVLFCERLSWNSRFSRIVTVTMFLHFCNHFESSCMRVMLAAFRASVPELARGFSTSLALLTTRQSCPPCVCSPTLNCPDIPRAADCICSAGTRVVDNSDWSLIVGVWVVSLFAVFALGIVASPFIRSRLHRETDRINRVISIPQTSETSESPLVPRTNSASIALSCRGIILSPQVA